MKKRIIFITVFLILILSLLSKPVISDLITGKATSQAVSMNIMVSGPADIVVSRPKNTHTYLTNDSLLLNYQVSGAVAVLYNIDSSNNNTLESNIRFNTSEGAHILYFYANNSDGLITSVNVSLIANSTRFVIVDSEFSSANINITTKNIRAPRKGSSTEFLDYSYEDIQMINNITLDFPLNGKIVINEPVNLTDDLDFSDDRVDIDSNINVSYNRIEINYTSLPNLIKNSTLYIYNISFSNPRILLNNEVCPVSICRVINFTGGILFFNVSNPSSDMVFSSEETPANIPGSPSGGSSSVGGDAASWGKRPINRSTDKNLEKTFEVDKNIIKVELNNGEAKNESITITNLMNKTQEIRLFISDSLKRSIMTLNDKIVLGAYEKRTIDLNFFALEDTKTDIYTGNLVIESEEYLYVVSIIENIVSKKPLFDIELIISPKYKKVNPGDELFFNLNLINLGQTGRIDATINYFIKDFENNVIATKHETVAVDTRASFMKSFELPHELGPGKYMVGANVVYGKETASSGDDFLVVEKETPFASFFNKTNLIIITVVSIGVLLIISYLLFKRRLFYKGKK